VPATRQPRDGHQSGGLELHQQAGPATGYAALWLGALDTLVASRPEEFLRRPALWADLIGRYRGTITSGPNFAYVLLALTLERAEPGRFDLSSLRVAINGAEPIDARDTSRLAEAGASVCVGTWPPTLNILKTMLERGKFDDSRRLADGSMMNFERI
jgi:acyl-CoA synthetase (AMP-forming)/AMP-acid ligase II